MKTYTIQSPYRRHRLHRVYLFFLILVLLSSSCGKKAPPTLAAYAKPPAPVLLRAVHRENRIILTWSFPEEKTASISGFTILKSSKMGLRKITVSKEDRSLADSNFSYGTSYTFRIIARSLSGVLSNDSNELTLTPGKPPPPPSGLSFRIEDDTVVLTWRSEGKGILYNVYRSFGKKMPASTPLNPSPLSENHFSDVFHIERPVYYTVRSLRDTAAEDEGRSSTEVTIDPSTLVPSAPRDLRYFSAPGKVFLYWKEPYERWITGYKIYRKTGKGVYKLIGETQVPTFLDTKGASGKRDYRVKAVGPSREGPGAELKGVFFRRDDLQ